VALPAGRARLATSPCWIGSALLTNTIGIVDVALAAYGATSPPIASSRSGFSRANAT